MYQTSQAFGNLIQQATRTFHLKVIVDGTTEITEGINTLKLIGGSNVATTFVLGSTVSQRIELGITKPPIPLEGHQIQPFVGLEIAGQIEYVPLGVFTAEKPQTDEGSTKLTAYDRMVNTERAYFSSLPAVTNTINVLNEMGTFLGITFVTTGLTSITMSKPEGYTCREVLSYIAQLYGGFAVCNREGKIEIQTYVDSSYRIEPERYWNNFKHNDYSFILEKITCYTGKDEDGKDISISVGSGAREMSFSNPLMTQAALTAVWAQLKNYTYMPGELKFLGDPRVDPWDVLTVVGTDGLEYKVPVMSLTQECGSGVTTTVNAVGWSENSSESKFAGPTVQKVERLYTKLALIDRAMINKLDVDTANINYAKITDLNALNAAIQNLDVVYAKIQDLKVIDASIANLTALTGDISHLLSGQAGIGELVNIHLTSENAVIESALIKDILSKHITVNDLLAGRIYTNRMEIWSDESGGMKLMGPTLQWMDKNNRVRMQAGLDAVGEFNYYVSDADGNTIFDAVNGLDAKGIKTPIIVDEMVSDEAKINGKKLDIDTVVSEINLSSSTIKGSKVLLDTTGQTLDIEFKQIHQEITAIEAASGAFTLYTIPEGSHVGDEETAVITAKLYDGKTDVTTTYPANRYLWIRSSEDAEGDAAWNSQQITGYVLELAGDEVNMIASFRCQFSIPDENYILGTDESVICGKDGSAIMGLTI